MSKYKFRKKEKTVLTENSKNDSVMFDDATKTRDFSIKEEKIEEEVFNPFEEDKTEKSSLFNFRSFMKSKSNEDKNDVAQKLDEIYSADVLSVEDIKDNLSDGKKFDLSKVFSDKKEKKSSKTAAPEIEIEEDFDGENDTYDVEEETTPIEEDIYDETDDGDDDFIAPVKPKKEKKEKVFFEYTDESQKEEINENYRKKGQLLSFAFFATLIITAILIYIETKFFPHPEWLMPGKFGVLYLLLDLQFVFLSAFCVINYIVDGAKALFTWHPNKNSITFITFCVSVLQIILHLSFNTFNKDVTLYSSIFSLNACITAFANYIDIRREHISFRIASNAKPKFAVNTLNETSAEYEKFSEYLPRDLSMYKITKTNFVTGFFKTNSKNSVYNEVYKISLPLVLLSSLIFSVLSTVLDKGAGFTDAINNFTLLFMISLPLSALLAVSFPFFITALRLSRRESAIIGENSVSEYANTSLVSFSDTDVFHEKGIKVTSIKTYGKMRIDTVFVTAAKIFKLSGGPLKDVFSRSVIDTATKKTTDELTEVTANGMTAVIDKEEVFVGNRLYMEEKGFDCYNDSIDASFERANGRIMYIASGGETSAKFYIKYSLGRNFKALLDSFYSIGICMAINSRDPNLDTKFVTQILKDENYPIVVVKREDIPTDKENEPQEKTTSGIVSSSSVSNMLRTFLSADKLSHLISMNTIVKYISLIFAITIVVVMFLAGHSHEKITPLFIMLYQFVWSLPMLVTSVFH